MRITYSETGLKEDVRKLVEAVKAKWLQRGATTSSFESLLLMVDLYGPNCLTRNQNCLGDSSDADYQISATVGIDRGEVLAVIGTLGTVTGNATYTSLALNQIPELKGVANISHKELAGSASQFSDKVPEADKLYVQYFARDCRGLKNCFQVTPAMIPIGKKIKILQRNYVAQGSARGPSPELVVNPTLVVLDGTKRSKAK